MPEIEMNVASEPVATEEVAETESASGADEVEEQEEQEEAKPKAKGGFQRRIDKLTREKYDLQDRVERLEREIQARGTPVTKESPKQPKMDDFSTLEEYVAALSEFNANHKIAALKQKESEESAKASWQESVRAYNSNIEEARDEFEDFDDVVGQAAGAIHEEVARAIVEMGDPRLAYALAKNPALVDEMSEMTPRRAIAELGRFYASLLEPAPKEKPKSNAPAPIKPVSGSAKSSVPLDQLDPVEFMKIRNKQERERRRL